MEKLVNDSAKTIHALIANKMNRPVHDKLLRSDKSCLFYKVY